jgi:transcriptional regulator with XRE-family HTH domain
MNIGNNIKKERIAKGFTQRKLAKELDKSESIIRKYEGGNVVPSVETCQLIANILGVGVEKILGISAPHAEYEVEVHALEILHECIKKIFISKGAVKVYKEMPESELQELAINIYCLLENKIDMKNGLFADNKK